MNETTRFTSRIAVALAVATFAGASAFADSRHPKTTDGRDEARASVVDRAERAAVSAPAGAPAPMARGRADSPRPVVSKRNDRADRSNRSDRARGGTTSRDRAVTRDEESSYDLRDASDKGRGRGHQQQYDQQPRGGRDRGNDHHGYSAGGTHGKRAPYYAHGRVSKVKPYNNGYRVWVAGSPYPYYVPQAYWRPGYFNVGMTIRVGGYYNPAGWYDYYGDYECDSIAEERMRGVVERIDYFRNEILLDVVGGGYVTVYNHDRHARVRPGDYIVVYGDWKRNGSFVALDVDIIDRAYRW